MEECRDAAELLHALKTGTDAGAVLLAQSPAFDPRPVPALVRKVAKCPVILFSLSAQVEREQDYDLVVPPLTDPAVWLDDIRTLIARNEALWRQSQSIQRDSRELVKEAAGVVRETRELIRRSKKLRRQSGK